MLDTFTRSRSGGVAAQMHIMSITLWISLSVVGLLLILNCQLANASATANAGYVDHGDTKGKHKISQSTIHGNCHWAELCCAHSAIP